MQRDKLRYVFGAATIAGMALLLIMAFGRISTPVTESASTQDVAALQSENAQLQQTLLQMQQRETQYQSELEAANETIRDLMAQSGLVAGDTQDGSLLPFDMEQFQDHRFFSGDARTFRRGDFGDTHQFFGNEERGF